ncbi:hypothetical protein [Halalkalibacter urbisdiaboli]|uniref:hypothetical protein n=1 Tax=Halalkalibacter urbisdiaboli TaxID=1960589 RepID=UPI000B44CF70|nr:hypothetical protein [Halalkalibacter urbisdiaboli]
MEKPVENKLNTLVGNSGNSDVDLTVNVDIDTKAIAYGIICSLYGRGDLNEQELEKAVRKLDSLVERDREKRKVENNVISASKPKLYGVSQPRRNWF